MQAFKYILLLAYVQVTDDASDVTMAHFMGEVGRRVPLAARFSTVTHEKGSPESLRDVRGFSVKMYTEEGNWDFVGNNIPVSQCVFVCTVVHSYVVSRKQVRT